MPKKGSKTQKNDQNHLKSPGTTKVRSAILSYSLLAMIDVEKKKISLKKKWIQTSLVVFLEIPVSSQNHRVNGFLRFWTTISRADISKSATTIFFLFSHMIFTHKNSCLIIKKVGGVPPQNGLPQVQRWAPRPRDEKINI